MSISKEAQEFLLTLANHSEVGFTGSLVVINLRDSLKASLLSAEQARAWLEQGALAFAAQTKVKVEDRLNMAGVYRDLPLYNEGALVRLSKQDPTHDGVTWTNIQGLNSLKRYSIDQDEFGVGNYEIPSASPNSARNEFNALQSQINEVIEQKLWCQPNVEKPYGAHLGNPSLAGHNCWVSTQDLDAGLAVRAQDTGSHAMHARRAAGLPANSTDDAWAVRIRFSASSARQLVGNAVARPTVTDGGNDWFRVKEDGVNDVHYAHHGWGHTHHIDRTAPLGSGRPERVVKPLAIALLKELQIDVLSPLTTDDNGKPIGVTTDWQLDDFVNHQLNGQSIHEVVIDVLTRLA